MHVYSHIKSLKCCCSLYSSSSLKSRISFSSFCYSLSLSSSSHTSFASKCFAILRIAISTSNSLLTQCTHACIIASGLSRDRFLANNLIAAYSKCGSISLAQNLFDIIPHRDIVSWNSLLTAYAKSAGCDSNNVVHGFSLFRLLRRHDISVTRLTLAPLLKLCLLSGYVFISDAVHGYAMKIGLEWDAFVSGALVNIYSKFGKIKEARILFNEVRDRDVVLWKVMFNAYFKHGAVEEALCFFSYLHHSGVRVDADCVTRVLAACVDVGTTHAEQIQALATKLRISDRDSDVITWNKKLSGYIQAGECWAAIDCFLNMFRSQIEHDAVTCVVVLAAVVHAGSLLFGQQFHGFVIKFGFDAAVEVGNSLINLYSKLGLVSSAQKSFSLMKELDLISWNSIISCCSQNGNEMESVNLFISLLRNAENPDHFTLTSVLRASSTLYQGLWLSTQVHAVAIKVHLISNIFVLTSLLDSYSCSGLMAEAELLFESVNDFDLALWNAMMIGYVSNENAPKALKLFSLMHASGNSSDEFTLATMAKACGCLVKLVEGKQIHSHAIKSGSDSDLLVKTSVLDLYVKGGEMVNARLMFCDIPTPDNVVWTSMISGCVDNGEEDEALSLYHQMRSSGIMPDEYTLSVLIKAASSLTALEQGKQIHANAVKLACVSDSFIATSLIDMYAKCGSIGAAYSLFKRTDAKNKNVTLWNAMLMGFAQHGSGDEALELFHSMKSHGILPDRVTFIAVLCACSHSGLVSEARHCFSTMQNDHGIDPEIEHYSCLVDALGRVGRIQDAEELILSMPFEASASMYRTLMGACRARGEQDAGKRIAAQLLALEPLDSSAHILLSNIYAHADQWDGVTAARLTMKKMKISKDPGFSWIDVKNKVHLFGADDRSHPEADAVYDKVYDLMRKIREAADVADTEFVLVE